MVINSIVTFAMMNMIRKTIPGKLQLLVAVLTVITQEVIPNSHEPR